jgi:transcriptional regulator with XRE-family HTH domain
MDVQKVGKAIAYLRKRAGYTQKDLADRIGVSDKAVSKWERGLGLPEIGYLRKLSILLDTDTDSLLAGDVVHHDNAWSGILVLKENRYGIGADTTVYDKPLIYYLLSYFLLVGIKRITVLCSKEDKAFLEDRFRGGKEYGFHLTAVTGTLSDVTVDTSNIMMVYGRCILYGVDQTRFFQKAMLNRDHFTMLVLPKRLSPSASRMTINEHKKIVDTNTDEPLRTQYDFSGIPILFFPSSILPAMSADGDIASFVNRYAVNHEMYVQMLDRGFVEIELDDWSNVQEASAFLKIIQDNCGMNVYCIEEVAWRRGLISLEQLRRHGEKQRGTEYGDYIMSLCERVAHI